MDQSFVWLGHGCGHGRPRTSDRGARDHQSGAALEQLGAALHARRKEKELREQLKKQEA